MKGDSRRTCDAQDTEMRLRGELKINIGGRLWIWRGELKRFFLGGCQTFSEVAKALWVFENDLARWAIGNWDIVYVSCSIEHIYIYSIYLYPVLWSVSKDYYSPHVIRYVSQSCSMRSIGSSWPGWVTNVFWNFSTGCRGDTGGMPGWRGASLLIERRCRNVVALEQRLAKVLYS